MKTPQTFPEINEMKLKDVREALNLAYTNGADGSLLEPEACPEFLARVAALEKRFIRLINTEARVKATQSAR